MSGWTVTKVSLTRYALNPDGTPNLHCHYPFHVQGTNELSDGRAFSWTVPSLQDARYDLSAADMTPEVRAVIAAHARVQEELLS